MPSDNPVTLIIEVTDKILLGYTEGRFGDLSGAVDALWYSMFVVFIAVYASKAIITQRLNYSDFGWHIFRVGLLGTLVTSWTFFQIFFYNLFTNTPDEILGILLHAESTNEALGGIYNTGIEASSKISENAGWSPSLIFASWLLYGMTTALVGYALSLIIMAKLALAVLLSIGPPAILMLVFLQTKTLFEGWLRQLINYALIPLFSYLILVLCIGIIAEGADHLTEITSAGEVFVYISVFILSCFVCYRLLTQVQNIGSGIAGGLSLSSIGFGSGIKNRLKERTAQAAGSTAKYIGTQASRATVNASKKAYGKLLASTRRPK